MLALADEDAAAYAGFGTAMKLPSETEDERSRKVTAIRAAARDASLVPFRTVEACHEIVALAESLAGRSNRNAASDLEVASLLRRRGAGGCGQRRREPAVHGDEAFAAASLADRGPGQRDGAAGRGHAGRSGAGAAAAAGGAPRMIGDPVHRGA